ncbi:MAG: AAA family ATPase, partial [Pseudomonadales bacterium]|nr:AAA family ATPase [Pseudomonadales bacterium]
MPRLRHRVPRKVRSLSLIKSSGYESLIKLIACRAMFKLGCLPMFVKDGHLGDDLMGEFLGLDTQEDEFNRLAVIQTLRCKYEALEKQSATAWKKSKALEHNLNILKELIGLSELECKLLVFLSLMTTDYFLHHVCDRWLDELSWRGIVTSLSVLLDEDPRKINDALGKRGRLIASGLLEKEIHGRSDITRSLKLISDEFADCLLSAKCKPEDFLEDKVAHGHVPSLRLADYCHIEEECTVLNRYLQVAIKKRQKGVNILVYGEPGTGKTELARLMAKEVGVNLYEVKTGENDLGFVGGDRLNAYKAIQSFFAGKPVLVLFDEMQDVFDDGASFFHKSTAQLQKAEINRLLETNPLPTIWLSNNVSMMDNAFLRRFDMVLKLGVPPAKRRAEILREAGKGLPLDEETIQAFSRHERLSPAIMNRASTVVKSICTGEHKQQAPEVLTLLFNQTLKAQGFSPIAKKAMAGLPAYYDLAYLNADTDLAALVEGVQRNPSARICLYGPPGTGKTAFAQNLAERLDKPMHSKKMSDLLSMYV